MPPSSSPPAALGDRSLARIPPSKASIPPSASSQRHLPPPSSQPRAATRQPYAHSPPARPDVAAISPAPARLDSTSRDHRCEPRPRTPSPPFSGKVDSKPKTVAATVKSRAHSRLASFGRIRSRGGQQPADLQPLATEPSTPPETYPVQPAPSLTGSHKRSEPSTASYHSSETTLSDEKFHDTKSFDEPRQQPIARDISRNTSADRRERSEDSACDTNEQYRRLVEGRSRMMHQTSSRLLRMTEDDRPFTRVSATHFRACAALIPAFRSFWLHIVVQLQPCRKGANVKCPA